MNNNSKTNIIEFTPKEKEEFIKRLGTYNTRRAALREMSANHIPIIKKLWRKAMQHKRQELDKEKVRLAKTHPEPSKNWQQIILKTVDNTEKNCKTIVFVINKTRHIGSSAGKRRFGDDTPEIKRKMTEEAKEDLAMVNSQINDLAQFIITKAIRLTERGDIAKIFKCAHQLAKKRRPKNKYLPPNKHQEVYKRVVYQFLGPRPVAHIKSFQNLLPGIALEAEDITVVFAKKHMDYSLFRDVNIIVYEISNMSPYQVLSNASGEPTINQLNEKEIYSKAILSKKFK